MIIAGIDPSMSSSGICRMDIDDQYEIRSVEFIGYNSVKKRCINVDNIKIHCIGASYKSKILYDKIDTCLEIFDYALEGVEHVAIEDFSYKSQLGNSTLQIAEFVGAIRKHIYDSGIKLERYSPNSIKMYATGSGTASKIMMLMAYKKIFPNYFISNIETDMDLGESPQSDIVDAFWICEILRTKLKYLAGISVGEAEAKLLSKSTSKSKALIDIIPEFRGNK